MYMKRGGEDTTYEIYKTEKGFKIVATSGTSPINKIGKGIFAIHDQNMRFLFEGQMIDFAVGSQLKEKLKLMVNQLVDTLTNNIK